MSKRILFFLFFLCFSFQASGGDSSLFVRRMVPEGKGIRQTDKIVFEFNRPVVALGEMERGADQIPIEIKPALNCRWRWLNQTSLACILGEKDRLAAAELYKIRVKPEFRALSGEDCLRRSSSSHPVPYLENRLFPWSWYMQQATWPTRKKGRFYS